MQAIIRSWRLSLDLLQPKRLLGLFKSALKAFGKTGMLFGRNFGWLLAIDISITLIFGDLIAKVSALPIKNGKAVGGPVILLMLAQSVVWFLTVSAFFLLMRKDDESNPKIYFRIYFFRYVQLLFFFSFLFLVGLYCFLAAGLTKIPSIPWGLLLVIKTVEYIIAFFWLDSPGGFIDLFKSIETAINTCFYNAPFIIILMFIGWAFDYSIGLVSLAMFGKSVGHALLGGPVNFAGGDTHTLFTSLKMILAKYLTFILENFWLCLLLAFYRRKKNELYSTSLFEKPIE